MALSVLQGIADGTVDIYISTSGGAAGIFPFVQVLDLPYLMRDDQSRGNRS